MDKLKSNWILDETVMPEDMNSIGKSVNELDDRAITLEGEIIKKADAEAVYSKEDSNKLYRKKLEQVPWEEISSKPATYPPATHNHNASYLGKTAQAEDSKKIGGVLAADVYHTGNKPTATDVGARPSTWNPTWNDVGAKPTTYPPATHNHDTSYLGKTAQAEDSKKIGGVLAADVYHSGNKQSGTIGTASRLDPTQNLNDLKTPGVYYQSSNANATVALNYPETQAGSLVVYMSAGVTQVYKVYNSSRIYSRSQYSSGAWTSWAKEYNTANKPTAEDVGARSSNWNPTWADVGSKPTTYPPATHNHDTAYLGKTATAENAKSADKLKNMQFNWEYGVGNPTHIWGSNEGSEMQKVFDPSSIIAGSALNTPATAVRASSLNNLTISGWYSFDPSSTPKPTSYGAVLHIQYNTVDAYQIAIGYENQLWTRSKINNVWKEWSVK